MEVHAVPPSHPGARTATTLYIIIDNELHEASFLRRFRAMPCVTSAASASTSAWLTYFMVLVRAR